MTDPTDWVTRLAAALVAPGEQPIAVDAPTAGALLRVAREVAHGTDRMNAPLSTYLAGRYVADRLAHGHTEDAALREFADAVTRLLAEAAGD